MRTKNMIVCPHCGKEFYCRPSRQKRQKYVCCSMGCYLEHRRRMRPEAYRVCLNCGKEFRTNPAYVKRRSGKNNCRFCSRKCQYSYSRKHRKCFIDSKGYFNSSVGRLHRILMEKYIGRKLGKDEVVHHRNGIRTDNRIENLEVMSHSEHSHLHSCGMSNKQRHERSINA